MGCGDRHPPSGPPQMDSTYVIMNATPVTVMVIMPRVRVGHAGIWLNGVSHGYPLQMPRVLLRSKP